MTDFQSIIDELDKEDDKSIIDLIEGQNKTIQDQKEQLAKKETKPEEKEEVEEEKKGISLDDLPEELRAIVTSSQQQAEGAKAAMEANIESAKSLSASKKYKDALSNEKMMSEELVPGTGLTRQNVLDSKVEVGDTEGLKVFLNSLVKEDEEEEGTPVPTNVDGIKKPKGKNKELQKRMLEAAKKHAEGKK